MSIDISWLSNTRTKAHIEKDHFSLGNPMTRFCNFRQDTRTREKHSISFLLKIVPFFAKKKKKIVFHIS